MRWRSKLSVRFFEILRPEDCTDDLTHDDRPAMQPAYVVKPSRNDLYSLTGPLLPWGLLYHDETDAVSYGHHLCRSTGGRVVVLDSHGNTVITEHIATGDDGLRVLNDYQAHGDSATDVVQISPPSSTSQTPF